MDKKRRGCMGKKAICLAMALAFLVLWSAAPVSAGSNEYTSAMNKKFMRGGTNLLTGWMEIPIQMGAGSERGFMGSTKPSATIPGMLAGAARGTWLAVGRTVSGAFDMIGCWAADPKGKENVGMPVETPYVWEEGSPYKFESPTFSKGTLNPIGHKFSRGFQNVAGGVCEIPLQMSKGIKEKAKDGGFSKGMWYFLSREVGGAYEMASCLFPAPTDYVGMEFNEEKPWGTAAIPWPKKEAWKTDAKIDFKGIKKEGAAPAAEKPKKDLWKTDTKFSLKGFKKEGASPAAEKPKKDLWKVDAKIDFKGIKKEGAAPKQQEK